MLDSNDVLNSRISVNFNLEIAIPPQSYLTIKEQEFIKLTVSGPSEPYDYTWAIESIDSSTITFKVDFKEPNMIGMFTDNEVVTIEFNKMLIKSAEENVPLINLIYEQELSMIIDKSD